MPLLKLRNADSLRGDQWLSVTTDGPGWQASSSQAQQAPAEPGTGRRSAFLGMCPNSRPPRGLCSA